MIPSILALILPITSVFLGFQLSLLCFKDKITKTEMLSISFPIGMLVQTLTSSLINIFFFCTIIHYGIIIALSILGSLFLIKFNSKNSINITQCISNTSLFSIIFWSLAACILSYYSIFPSKDNLISTGENDMYLEISMIASLTKGANKHSNFLSGFQISIMQNIKTRTGILTFLYSALIKTTGCSLSWSILVPTFFLFISISFLSFSYIYRKTRNQFIAMFAFPTIFLLGGFGFTHYVNNNDRSKPNTDFVFYIGNSQVLNWGHPLLHTFLTSRLNLFCLSLSLIVFILCEANLNHYAAIISLLTFLVRPQSGFILSMIFFLYSANFSIFIQKVKYYFIPFVVLSISCLPIFKLNFSSPLWLSDYSNNSFFPFLSFAFNVYGVGFIILILMLFKSPYQVFLSLFPFYFLAYVSLQQDHRFNFFTTQSVVTPLIVCTICCCLSSLISYFSLPQIRGSLYGITIFLFVIMWLSSLCGIYHRFGQKIQIFGENENIVAKWIRDNTKRNSVFASPVQLKWNPAVTRAGRVGFVANQNEMQDYEYQSFDIRDNLTKFVRGNLPYIPVDYFIFRDIDNEWKHHLFKHQSLNIVFNNSKFYVMKMKDQN